MKMVHCPSCGATFADTEERCPYCGNTHVAGAKAAYTGRMQCLREQLAAHTVQAALYRRIIGKGVVCFLLLTLITGLMVSLFTAERRASHRRIAHADTNVEAYSAVIDHYLQDGDYLRAAEYMEYRSIHIVSADDPYVRYAVIRDLLQHYDFLFRRVVSAACDGALSSVSIDATPQWIVSFYDMCSEDYLTHHPYAGHFDPAETADIAGRMRGELEVLMQYYFHLTDEDIASLPVLSERQIKALLSERIGKED